MIVVDLTLATICFLNACFPALVGKDTPVGEFQIVQRLTDQPGYGGDVLQFKEDEQAWYAIHRVWVLRPKEKRLERLRQPDPNKRVITAGCINVEPDVYDKLRDCCSQMKIVIKK